MQAALPEATRVLLIEDEVSDALIVRRSLRCRGRSRARFSLEHASTLAQGIEHLDRCAVDVLLLDLHLPDSDGSTTVERLRERDDRVPLVAVTGDDDPGLVARAFEAGADEYLVKCDLHTSLLRRTIRHAIERRRSSPAPDVPSRASDRGEVQRALLHDLKNLHTSILGNARLLQEELEGEGFLGQRARALVGAARAATDVARRIGDADDAEETVHAIDLSAFVRTVEPLLRAALSERVELHLELAGDLAPVSVYPDAMRQIVLELVVNAAEAIGDEGGRVEIRTGSSVLAERKTRERVVCGELGPGAHVWLEVVDHGRRFDGATRARMLERGFSTKGSGRGHGLGQVQALLARYRGGLLVGSDPSTGTAFRVLIPANP